MQRHTYTRGFQTVVRGPEGVSGVRKKLSGNTKILASLDKTKSLNDEYILKF